MDDGSRAAKIVRFGIFEADLQTGELRKNGLKVPLQGQPFQVCAILLQHSGKLVTREELRQKVWPEDTFVDFDHALNTAIAKIRIALGDDADNPRFVETLPRRGYRFIGPVDKASSQASPEQAGVSKRLFEILAARVGWIAVGVTLLLLLSGVGIRWFFRKSAESPQLSDEVLPVSGLPGAQAFPAFSPDSNQVAFITENQNPGIYTTLIGGEKPLRLTSDPGDSSPTWSPDGQQVAFSRLDPKSKSMSICLIPALGGTEHRLYTFPYSGSSPWLNWSPDGTVLAFVENRRIELFSIANSTTRPLTSPPDQDLDDAPSFSPDAGKVAFVRESVAGVIADLFVVPVTGGEPKRLTFDNRDIYGPPAWTPDGRDIVFSSPRRGLPTLWRISASGGTPRPVAGVVMASQPSISPKGNQLAYVHEFGNVNLWRVALKDEKHPQGAPASVISARRYNFRPHFSPDGKRIAFESDRSGYSEIWACDSDGSNCGQLTSLRGTAGAARWSPDGHFIAFEFHPKEHSEIYVVEVPGGLPRLVTTFPGADNGAPSWSRDGQWIYFYSDREGGRLQLWKVAVNGGPPVQITRNGGVFAAESADGSFLYYSKFDVPGIWKMPLDGGEETYVLDQPEVDSYSWALVRNGIYFLNQTNPLKPNIEFFEFATGKRILISSLDKSGGFGLTVSPDGRSIVFDQGEFFESTIMLVKNFR